MLKTSPEAARDITDEVNQAYAWAEDNYDLEENDLAIEVENGELIYCIVSEATAEDFMIWG